MHFAFWSFRDIPIILSNFLLLLLHHYIQLHTYTPTLLSLIINLVSNFFCLLFLFLPQVSSVFFAGNSWPQITRYSGWRYNNFTVAELKALKVTVPFYNFVSQFCKKKIPIFALSIMVGICSCQICKPFLISNIW